MDLWGWCDRCVRWYYLSGDPQAHCPVCQSPPRRTELRPETPGHAAVDAGDDEA